MTMLVLLLPFDLGAQENPWRKDLLELQERLLQVESPSLPLQVERRLKALANFENKASGPSGQAIPGASFTQEEMLALEQEVLQEDQNVDSDSVSMGMAGRQKVEKQEKPAPSKRKKFQRSR